MKKVMIVDGTNLFFVNYFGNPYKQGRGENARLMGGYSGFYTSLQRIIKEINPSRVYICWEGRRSKDYRLNLLSEYKAHRKTSYPYFGKDFDEEELQKNKNWQFKRLKETIKDTSLVTVSIDELEADDSIAMLCNKHNDDNCIIVSGDSDFFQLVTGNVKQYHVKHSKLYSEEDVLEAEGVSRINYLLAKSIVGDTSDNIKGVKGVGTKTLVKTFPEFKEDEEVTLQDVMNKCDEELKNPKCKKIFGKLKTHEEKIKVNLEVISLSNLHLRRPEKYEELLRAAEEKPKFKVKDWKLKLAEDDLKHKSYWELMGSMLFLR